MNVKHLIRCLLSSKCSVNLNYIMIIIFLVMQRKTPANFSVCVLREGWANQCGKDNAGLILLQMLRPLPQGNVDV